MGAGASVGGAGPAPRGSCAPAPLAVSSVSGAAWSAWPAVPAAAGAGCQTYCSHLQPERQR